MGDIKEAYERADVNANGKDKFDPVENNSGVFLKNVAVELGYHVSPSLTEKIATCLVSAEPDFVEAVRENGGVSDFCRGAASDLDLMDWVVERLASETYVDGDKNVTPVDCEAN